MFKEIKNFLVRKVNGANYDSGQKTGQFGSSGSHIDDDDLKPESGNKYESNANVPFDVNTDGGKNLTAPSGVEAEIHTAQNNNVSEMLGNPSVNRPSKNSFKNVDRQLESQYFSNMETR